MKKASIFLAALVIIFSSCRNGTSTTPAADTSKVDKKRDTVAYADSTIQPHGPDKQ